MEQFSADSKHTIGQLFGNYRFAPYGLNYYSLFCLSFMFFLRVSRRATHLTEQFYYTVKPNLTNIRGDVNGNQLVEVSDAVEVLKYYAKKAAGLESVFSETTAENEAIFNLADVNKDGEITVQDAVLILTYYAKAASGGKPTWEELTSA